MTADDDQLWLDTLAGRVPSDHAHAASIEAGRLRAAIAQRQPIQTADAPARDLQREAQLLARAAREGLIDPAKLHRRSGLRQWLNAPAAMLAYAAVACVVVGIALLMRPVADTEVVRGARDGIVTIEAVDPGALKAQLLAELRAAGASATGYERFGRQGIDAELPQPLNDRIRAVLEKHHLEEPADGTLKIEIAVLSKP
jgi:hypothetical protein